MFYVHAVINILSETSFWCSGYTYQMLMTVSMYFYVTKKCTLTNLLYILNKGWS